MAMIVIEGSDNSGKSTLARHLAAEFNLPVIRSEGPDKGGGEINQRIWRYNEAAEARGAAPMIFDRHPCVSEVIYCQFRNDGTCPVDGRLIENFYKRRPLFIYCADRGLASHVEKEHDKPEHLDALRRNHDAICLAYMGWAIAYANIWYRVGDRLDLITAMIAGIIWRGNK